MSNDGDEKISDMTELDAPDSQTFIPAVRTNDLVNYKVPFSVFSGGSTSRVGAQVIVPAGTQPIDFSTVFVATYSLMTDARDSGGNRVDIQILTRDANGFSVYTVQDIILDYRADVAQ